MLIGVESIGIAQGGFSGEILRGRCHVVVSSQLYVRFLLRRSAGAQANSATTYLERAGWLKKTNGQLSESRK